MSTEFFPPTSARPARRPTRPAMDAHIVPSEHVLPDVLRDRPRPSRSPSTPTAPSGASCSPARWSSRSRVGRAPTGRGDTYFVPDGARHIARIRAGYKGIDVFADPTATAAQHDPTLPPMSARDVSASLERRGNSSQVRYRAPVAVRAVRDAVAFAGREAGEVRRTGRRQRRRQDDGGQVPVGHLQPDHGEVLLNGEDATSTRRSRPAIWDRDGAPGPGADRPARRHRQPVPQPRAGARSPARSRWFGWVGNRRMHREAKEILDSLHINIPSVRRPIERLSGGQRQAVPSAERSPGVSASC